MIQFDVLTIFPEIFSSPLKESILARAQEQGLIKINLFDLRSWTQDKHRTVDDAPFGGGDGMVFKPEVLEQAILELRSKKPLAPAILLTPQGRRFDQSWAQQLAGLSRIILVCGRYAGIDQRVVELLIDEELSIGDYVLSGGEIPALVVIEAISRLIPGVLGNKDSARYDSFPARLEWAQYTRPRNFHSYLPPEPLLSGDHQRIERFREKDSLKRTLLKRPDLLLRFPPSPKEEKILEEIKKELWEN